MLPKKTINWTLPYSKCSFYRHSVTRAIFVYGAVEFSKGAVSGWALLKELSATEAGLAAGG